MTRALHILGLLATGWLLAGCSDRTIVADAPQGSPVEIRFWNGFSGPDRMAITGIVDRFNASQREVLVRMDVIPWGTNYDKVTLALAFGGAPDLFVVHANRFPEFASHDVLSPLDDDLKAAGIGPKLFTPRTWEAARWKGRQYALPLDVHPLGLFYNRKLFREAGIDRPPATYAEFLETARRLTKRLNEHEMQWGFAFTNLSSNSYCFMNQFGGGLVTPDFSRANMASPQTRAALEQMKEILAAKVAPKPEGQDAWTGFKTGRVAMAMEGVYMMADLDAQKGLDYAAAPAPQFGPQPGVWAGSHLLVIPKNEPPRKRAAAWKFAHYLSDHSLEWAAGGQVPARSDIRANPEFAKMRVQFEIAKQIDDIVYEPQTPANNLITTFKDSAVEKVLNGIGTVDSALTTADRRINNVLGRQVK